MTKNTQPTEKNQDQGHEELIQHWKNLAASGLFKTEKKPTENSDLDFILETTKKMRNI